MGLFARLKNFIRNQCKKSVRIGLALGSGGAKGMAHLGALQAFEEEGIRFSVVTGSSIGSIVGALYAKGYSSADMMQIVENLNRKEFSKNLRPFADLTFAENFLERYLEGDFTTLSIPFAAWATDGDNEGVLLSEGKLARALTASSAIPPYFRGVEVDGRKLYDGAFTNAVPADVCKRLGAQFVIGIDLSAFTKPAAERSAIARLFGSAMDRLSPVRYTKDCKSRGYENADIMLCPDLKDFYAADVSAYAMKTMYEKGYREAKSHMDEIKRAISKVK